MEAFVIVTAILAAVAVVLVVVALIKKPDSVYMNRPEERNPLEGKLVRFVENDEEPINADGVRGHLEAVGTADRTPSFYEKVLKRLMDVLFSFLGMVILSPVFLVLTLWIIMDDPGPAIFTQKRLGKNKQYFKIHKFRSMKMLTPRDKPTHMLENAQQYTTRAGRIIRAYSLDELPQLWDIFIGNMSVIGPRPGLWNQDLLTAERDKYGANDIKPGLTGWAQINGRDRLDIPMKAKLDGEYTQNLSLWMDIRCFFRSFQVLTGDPDTAERLAEKPAKDVVSR